MHTFSWENEEIKTLFKFVEIKKQEGMPLVKIFELFADFVGREKNSVRNFYYAAIKNFLKNPKYANGLKINIKNHYAKEVLGFDNEQAIQLEKSVDELIENGYSVRGACLCLANGDATKMIRIQNKYRALKKQTGEAKMGNIIKMPAKNIMSDEDINALFLGLLKLVKKQEYDKAKLKMQHELEEANQKLKNALNEIVLRRAEIEKLREQIFEIKQMSKEKYEEQIKTRIEQAKSGKATKVLAKFIENIGLDDSEKISYR